MKQRDMFEERNKKTLRIMFILFFSVILLTGIQRVAIAEDYPTKTITIYTPYAPGGGNEIAVRILAEIARGILGQPIVVVNKPGGGGIIAQSIVAKEKPDGYSLAVTSNAAFVQVPQMRDVEFDPLKDFEFIIKYFAVADGLVCRSEKAWKSFKDLIIYSQKRPGEITYGTPGKGSANHIAAESITSKEGIKWRMVPYEGAPRVAAALLGGHIDLGICTIQSFKPHVTTGEFRLLAIAGAGKAIFPNVPSPEDLGYDLTFGASFGIIAPKGTPTPIIKKLQNTFKKAMEDPKYEDTCKKLDAFNTYASGEDFFKELKKEYIERGKVLKEIGLLKSK